MLNRRGISFLLVVGLMFLLAALISTCGPTPTDTPVGEITVEPTDTPEGEVTTEPTDEPHVPTPEVITEHIERGITLQISDVKLAEFEEFLIFAEDYFIVTGYESRIDCAFHAVLSQLDEPLPWTQIWERRDALEARATECELNGENSQPPEDLVPELGLTLVNQLDLKYVKDLVGTCGGLPQFQGLAVDRLVLRLYRIDRDVDLGLPLGGRPLVRWIVDDLNLVTIADLVLATGDVDGAPYIPGDSDWNVPGSTGNDPQQEPTEEEFLNQWALGPTDGGGIGLLDEGTRPRDYPTGQNVVIMVADTNPFTNSHPSDLPADTTWLQTIPSPDLPSYGFSQPPGTTVADHGLYVAGLIHAVAPDSQVQLYRVLNEFGVGDLFTLDAALHTFISHTLEYGPSNGAIINLSLGGLVPKPSDLMAYMAVVEAAGGEIPADDPMVLNAQATIWQQYVQSMKILLSAAHCEGIVTVAAAGNEALDFLTPAVVMETIAVEASNQDRERSCFSSLAIGRGVKAPGGDGDTNCLPALNACPGGCTAVIGPVLVKELSESGQVSHRLGYRYWSGTSFAAPLVSGMAALILEAEGGQVTPDEVYDRIKHDASENEGVIVAR